MASSTPWTVQPTPPGQPQFNNPTSPQSGLSETIQNTQEHQFTNGVDQAQSDAAKHNGPLMHPGEQTCGHLCQWSKQKGHHPPPKHHTEKHGYKWDEKTHAFAATGTDEGDLTTSTEYDLKSGTFTGADGKPVSYENAWDPTSVTTTYKNDVGVGAGGSLGCDAPAGVEGKVLGVDGGETTIGPYPIEPGQYPPGIGPQYYKK